MPTWMLLAVALAACAVALVAGFFLRAARRQQARLRQELAKATEALSTKDEPLAGMMSRAQFEAALDQAVARSDHGGGDFCLLYIDLDNFRAVNDAFGHDRGDELLKHAARQLRECAGGGASHVAADEFAVIVDGEGTAGLQAAERIALALSQKQRAQQQASDQIRLTCSIGIARYPEHGSRPLLQSHAMLAMRSVKLAGGASHAEYHAQMGVGVREQASLLRDLRLALERKQLELFYQPKIDARSLQVTAAEALLRWRHPERGMVSPAVFVPLAERHGLIGDIGQWVLEQACIQAAQWRERGLRMRVAVNISGVQMRQDDIVERISAALKTHGIKPGRFTCEITESVAMEDTHATRRAFERLRAAGVHVSIDDFGTGYSSLASLRKLPAAELKIDRAFVCDLETSADARSIAQAILQMAHTLGLRVVAEGVETEAQRDLLVDMGCDELQGYLFAKPMTAQSLELWAMNDGPEAMQDFRPSLFDETRPTQLGGEG